MNRSQEFFDTIEQFLSKRLSEKKQNAFTKEMSQNPELEVEVQKHRYLHTVLKDKKALNFKKELQSIHKELFEEEEKNTQKPKQRRYIRLVAAMLLLIGVSGLVWQVFMPQTPQDLYATYYTPYPVSTMIRASASEEWTRLVTLYQNEQYDRVITNYTNEPVVNLNDELRLYIGNSYLQQDEPQKAMQMFSAIANTSGFYEDAQWYLALAYLKENNLKKMTEVLESIIRYNGKYVSRAIELKDK